MADPVSDTAHLNSTDHEANGFLESAEDPTAEADSIQPEVMDASNANHSALTKPTDSSTATQDPHQSFAPNGHAAQESLQHNGHGASADLEESSADSATGSPQEPEEEPWKKRLYFVRVPKFPEDNQYAVKVLQEEIDVYKSQVQLLNESVNIVRVRMLRDYIELLSHTLARLLLCREGDPVDQRKVTFRLHCLFCRCSEIVPKRVWLTPRKV